MTTIRAQIDSETARIRAVLVNSGRCSFDEADRIIDASCLTIELTEEAVGSAAGQAAFLTAVATGARCFGTVEVRGALEEPLRVRLPLEPQRNTLGDCARMLGARSTTESDPERVLVIGTPRDDNRNARVQAYWDGWIAGTAPAGTPAPSGRGDCVLAGVAAGALGVGQAFLAAQGNVRAGRTRNELSLWSPDARAPREAIPGPDMASCHMPTAFWLIGLGNLGQAYLWSLAFLPYPEPERVLLFLQDDDHVRRENWGTSILVRRGAYGDLKTRMAEDWALRRGFHVRRIDRQLDEHLRRMPGEPALALAGLDGMPARRLLGKPGFEFVVDGGLGATAADYSKFRLNVFDSNADPAAHFNGVDEDTSQGVERLMELPAYQALARATDELGCGKARTLAGKSVAVPFVSAVTGALAIAQTIRIACGKAGYASLTGDIRDIAGVRATQESRIDRLRIPTTLAAIGE